MKPSGSPTEAEAIARRLGDDDVLGHVLLGARLIGRHPSRLPEHERIGVELERLGDAMPSLALKLAGMLSPGVAAPRPRRARDRGRSSPSEPPACSATAACRSSSSTRSVYRATRALPATGTSSAPRRSSRR